MKKILVMLASIWQEFNEHRKRIARTFIESIKLWWGGTWARKLIDIAIALGITVVAPYAAIAMGAANFMDDSNTLYATISMTIAFVVLELTALWVLEAIVILCGFQVAVITRRIGSNYRKRLEMA